MTSFDGYSAIQECINFTNDKIARVEKSLDSVDLRGSNLVVNGSYARREASDQSDFDYFLIFPATATEAEMHKVSSDVARIVESAIGKMPAEGGAFGSSIREGELSREIGGPQDTNYRLTLRILFLTEGLPIGSRNIFDKQKIELIERYIQDTITDHQLALFFLNDVIRYWRTICVDFENKTFEKGKDWGVRNAKLVFSRKLLYFGGVLIAGQTGNCPYPEKREIFSSLMQLSPLERLTRVCGLKNSSGALLEYNYFLKRMMDANFRKNLLGVDRDRATQTDEFKDLKAHGHAFTGHLINALKSTYDPDHPIHHRLIM